MLSCSCMGQLYPQFPNENDIRHFIESLPDRQDHETKFPMLHFLIQNYSKLEAIGSSLPEMMEFYKFIFCDLSQTISKEAALNITVKAKVDDIVRRYKNCDHLPDLYRLVIGNNNLVL